MGSSKEPSDEAFRFSARRLRRCRRRCLWKPHTRTGRAERADHPDGARRVAHGRNATRASTSGVVRGQGRARAWLLRGGGRNLHERRREGGLQEPTGGAVCRQRILLRPVTLHLPAVNSGYLAGTLQGTSVASVLLKGAPFRCASPLVARPAVIAVRAPGDGGHRSVAGVGDNESALCVRRIAGSWFG